VGAVSPTAPRSLNEGRVSATRPSTYVGSQIPRTIAVVPAMVALPEPPVEPKMTAPPLLLEELALPLAVDRPLITP
jgi:hypothetical protein